MIRSHDVLAINEESRAAIHIVVSKGHEEGEKDDTDKLFHDVTAFFHKDFPLVKQVLSIYRQKRNHCKTIFQKNMKKKRKALCRSASRLRMLRRGALQRLGIFIYELSCEGSNYFAENVPSVAFWAYPPIAGVAIELTAKEHSAHVG